METNGERLKLLELRRENLEAEIDSAGRWDEYTAYVERVADRIVPPRAISDEEWELLLPEERSNQLIAYYHTVRTEQLELTKAKEHARTLDRATEWLESPLVRLLIASGTLVEAALLIVKLVEHAHLILRVDGGDRPKTNLY